MFPTYCALSGHYVSVLVDSLEVTLVESTELALPSLPSPPGSR